MQTQTFCTFFFLLLLYNHNTSLHLANHINHTNQPNQNECMECVDMMGLLRGNATNLETLLLTQNNTYLSEPTADQSGYRMLYLSSTFGNLGTNPNELPVRRVDRPDSLSSIHSIDEIFSMWSEITNYTSVDPSIVTKTAQNTFGILSIYTSNISNSGYIVNGRDINDKLNKDYFVFMAYHAAMPSVYVSQRTDKILYKGNKDCFQAKREAYKLKKTKKKFNTLYRCYYLHALIVGDSYITYINMEQFVLKHGRNKYNLCPHNNIINDMDKVDCDIAIVNVTKMIKTLLNRSLIPNNQRKLWELSSVGLPLCQNKADLNVYDEKGEIINVNVFSIGYTTINDKYQIILPMDPTNYEVTVDQISNSEVRKKNIWNDDACQWATHGTLSNKPIPTQRWIYARISVTNGMSGSVVRRIDIAEHCVGYQITGDHKAIITVLIEFDRQRIEELFGHIFLKACSA